MRIGPLSLMELLAWRYRAVASAQDPGQPHLQRRICSALVGPLELDPLSFQPMPLSLTSICTCSQPIMENRTSDTVSESCPVGDRRHRHMHVDLVCY